MNTGRKWRPNRGGVRNFENRRKGEKYAGPLEQKIPKRFEGKWSRVGGGSDVDVIAYLIEEG